MYARFLDLPGHSFFLFGPRATGKTTWLRSHLPDAQWHDLLRSEVYLALARDAVEKLEGVSQTLVKHPDVPKTGSE